MKSTVRPFSAISDLYAENVSKNKCVSILTTIFQVNLG